MTVRWSAGDPALDAQFKAFDASNPSVFNAFAGLAAEMYVELVAAGKKPVFGAKFVWERLRWTIKVDTKGTYGKGFKLDNDLVSRYARKLAEQDARFADAFRFRMLKKRHTF